jgi:DNA-binding LacI/PurR family transcriptional regulator
MEYGKLKLAKEFGVSKSVISRILDGKSWKVSSN